MMLNPKITISGANEHTDIEKLVALVERYYHYKGIKIELGIQVSPTKASFDSDRCQWLMELHKRALGYCYVYLSLHINPGWVEQVCAGSIPLELIHFMNLFGYHHNGGVILERIQLNFLIGREQAPDMNKLRRMIEHYHYHGVYSILTCNEENKQFIDEFYSKYFARGNCYFDLLFNKSDYELQNIEQSKPQCYPDVVKGYSGDFCEENIAEELSKIAQFNSDNKWVWIDTHGLKDTENNLDLKKADAFMQKVQEWYQKNTQS